MTQDLHVLERVVASHREADQPGAAFRAADAALREAVGHILFTILISHHATQQSERCYTNMPDAYPVGGRKPMSGAPLMTRLMAGEPYIGRTAADIEWAFFDHVLIRSLGCESVLNMPVLWRGRTVGTLNLLDRAGHYEEAHLPVARAVGALALPAMLLAADTGPEMR